MASPASESPAYRSEPFTLWVDERMVMRRSPTHGIGSFAAASIAVGERLFRSSGGIVYTADDWRSGRVQLAGEMYNEERIDDDLYRATPKAPGYYVNHSCDPNVFNGVAFRDIEAGEELVSDYATGEVGDFVILEQCRCGSDRCRGRITGQDWMQPDLQVRYAGHFHPSIQRLIDAQSSS